MKRDDKKIINLVNKEEKLKIETELKSLRFTKNFRSASAEEWYLFLEHFQDPNIGGAAGKVIVHYNLYGNREVFINTTIIIDDPLLHEKKHQQLLYAICDETIDRLVGYADTLLSVHAGKNSYDAEYVDQSN
ncbi:hypothetical protein [Litchfieldia salsa]|uniref:Uncharacterized protein n=1 Tax=Litchfieldia salsa TaxID=930152 RepID=A0A1H0WI00_9BACI|nr:hypothetical protein [Litchfieldia salsa]SDP90171.1 hypothetical protein SAMN05216565_111117 [Litchfieldia salsa]